MVQQTHRGMTPGPERPIPVLRLTLTALAVLLALFGVATLFGFFLETSTAAMRVPEGEPPRRELLRVLLGVAAVSVGAILAFFTLLGMGRRRPQPPPP